MPVVVEGVPELKKALKKFAPDLRKQMDDEIRVVLKEVVNEARSKLPGQAPGNLYNWNDTGAEVKSRTSRARAFPKYDARVARRGITYSLGRGKRNRSGFSSLYSLLNKSAAGAIIETSGRKSGPRGSNDGQSNNPNAGAIFVGAMNAVGPLKSYDRRQVTRGRVLYAAYTDNNGKALDGTMRAIEKAARLFRERTTVRKAA